MGPISTRHLEGLPDIETLRALLQSLAALDAIMSPKWEYRYYFFNSAWSTDEQMGSMRNGSGDEFLALFNTAGCFIKGFDRECTMSPYHDRSSQVWPGVLDDVPADFSSAAAESAFSIQKTTFCIWRFHGDSSWSRGPVEYPPGNDPDGSKHLLSILDCDPRTYHRFAQQYYETTIPLDAVVHIYQHQPLTTSIVHTLNASPAMNRLISDLREIGYPGA